jgi:ATP-dependent RNA helicase DHX37/DHR1
MAPPTALQAKLLRQIILAGSPDHVARKIPEDEIKDSENKARWRKAYRCVGMEDPVFIHPSSVLSKTLPDYVVYQEIIETKKLYMKGVTGIEADWLPIFCPCHCSFSMPLEDPPPRYDEDSRRVKCFMNVTYGPACWVLEPMELDYPSGAEQIRWFARFLLEGKVCSKLLKYTPHLLSQPSSMVKSWANLQPRTGVMLSALMKEGVDSRDKLLAAWENNPNYLFSAYSEWLPQTQHMELTLSWPPV